METPLPRKNQILPLAVTALSSDGSGVARTAEGFVVFVPGTAPGDVGEVRIVKVCKSHAFGRLERLRTPGPGRTEPDCPVAGPCGGCGLRHLRYEAECEAKTGFVRDAFARIGGLDVPVAPLLPAPCPDRYRNKVQLPFGTDVAGHLAVGFYAARSHRIVPCADCRLQPRWMNELAARACALLAQAGAAAYDEAAHTGLLRHLYLRQGWHSGQRLVCFILNGERLPNEQDICRTLAREFALTTVLVQTNTRRTNVILGAGAPRTVVGPGFIEDTLAGVPLQMGVQEFYQVNIAAAELLYAKARELAALRPDDFLLDLYCGMGSIGLSMAADCARLLGVEVVPEAVEGAKATARRLGLAPARAEFLCADAGQAARQLAAQGQKPDVIIVDPPRKGCDTPALEAIAAMAPRTVVMVSCDPATAARDVRWLCGHGYRAGTVQPVDLFPRTRHVETVCLLSKLNVKQHIEVELTMDEMDLTAAEKKASYEEIKEYVLEKFGMKVSHLYIAQVKRKCGIIERENYNKPKSEDSRQPQCPPEKEAAIRTALEHFGMI